MLRSLEIRDLLLIHRLELEFQPGLNVLTGETGAGKSILLDALGFVLGWRGKADLVRDGAQTAEVTAEFDLDPDHPARNVLKSAGLPVEDQLLLRRSNTQDGRKTAWVNDRRCAGEVLRALSATLVELHGQHDERGLLDARGHRALLDAYGSHQAIQSDVANRWAELRDVRAARSRVAEALAAARQEEENLRSWVAELEAFSPEAGEATQLDIQRQRMRAAESVLSGVHSAAQLVGDSGAELHVSDALRRMDDVLAALEGGVEDDEESPVNLADNAARALERSLTEISEARMAIEACASALQFDASELDRVSERLFDLRDLAKKHKVQPDELADVAVAMRARLDLIDHDEADAKKLEQEEKKLVEAYEIAARSLSNARRSSAARLDAGMAQELAPLKMERATFETRIEPCAAGPDGQDTVAFTVATNPGAPSGALNKIASGGELSRFLLALKVCLSGRSTGLTLIFDEIDRGVGGATADAVGRRLAALATGSSAQVLVVTHSPQVAARGDHHWRVSKSTENQQTTTSVVPLKPNDRLSEIARMLAGDRITKEARSAARVLLEDAK